MPDHLSLLKNNSENSRIMSYHPMPHHISPLKNNSKNLRKSPHPTSHFSIKKTLEKIYYNSLSVINGELSQHATMPHHLSPLKIILKTLENIFFSNYSLNCREINE
jgi:hypothetical protein